VKFKIGTTGTGPCEGRKSRRKAKRREPRVGGWEWVRVVELN
jgi:hypothetical protein